MNKGKMFLYGALLAVVGILANQLVLSRRNNERCLGLVQKFRAERQLYAKQASSLCERYDADPMPCVMGVVRRYQMLHDFDQKKLKDAGCPEEQGR